jgi:hypothetical protein
LLFRLAFLILGLKYWKGVKNRLVFERSEFQSV